MTTPEHTYRPCAGCDSVGESCRAVGCPATPERDGAAVEAAHEALTDAETEFVYDWTPDDPAARGHFARSLWCFIAAREAAAKAEAWREAAEEWPKMRGSHTRSDVAQWLRERADREAP